MQNALAWEIAANPTIEQRDLTVAKPWPPARTRRRNGSEPAVLDTLARVQFIAGKKGRGDRDGDEGRDLVPADQKADYQTTLDSYKKGELPKLGPSEQQ